MIYTKAHLPKGYKQYNSLTICSNVIKGGGHFLSVNNALPLIIGKGTKPQIWIQAMSSSNAGGFISIVENSVAKNSAVKIFELDGVMNISVDNKRILSVKSNADSDSAQVDFLDMRPIGLNIYGDSKLLTVGTSTFVGNSMSGGGVLFGFDA